MKHVPDYIRRRGFTLVTSNTRDKSFALVTVRAVLAKQANHQNKAPNFADLLTQIKKFHAY